jgi:hypothetical protein
MIKTKHMFQLSRIINKMGLGEDIKMIMEETEKEKVNESALGYKIVMALASKLHMAEAEVMTLLADISGKTRKEIEDQAPKETFDMIRAILSEEGVLDFLLNQQTDLKSD